MQRPGLGELGDGRDVVILERELVVLAEREAFPIVGAEDAARVAAEHVVDGIGVVVEDDTDEVVGFAFVPVGGAPEVSDAGQMGIVARDQDLYRESGSGGRRHDLFQAQLPPAWRLGGRLRCA